MYHVQAQAQAQAQNMAFQAHNLQAHAQQLEVESAHAVTSHINVGLQPQIHQVQPPPHMILLSILPAGLLCLAASTMSCSNRYIKYTSHDAALNFVFYLRLLGQETPSHNNKLLSVMFAAVRCG